MVMAFMVKKSQFTIKLKLSNSQALPWVQLHLWIQEDQGLPKHGKKEDRKINT